MSLSAFYSECSCCRNAETARLQRIAGGKSPAILSAVLAPDLQGTTVDWNDATRGAYRAQRRKDDTA